MGNKPFGEDPSTVRPMLATLVETHSLVDPRCFYEPKLDGIRALADFSPDGPRVRLFSRNGNDKTEQFPEIAQAMEKLGRKIGQAVLLDGEIVVVDAAGEPLGFEALQPRIFSGGDRRPVSLPRATVGGHRDILFVFDVLRIGDEDLRPLPLVQRRMRLAQIMGNNDPHHRIRTIDFSIGNGETLFANAVAKQQEGLVIKRADSRYQSGQRSADWVKLKLTLTQEFVVAGWTEPRGARPGIGALLLGVHDESGVLRFVGGVGSGLDDRILSALIERFLPMETRNCPFTETPETPQPAHWLAVSQCAQVRFSEWTQHGHLRHPVFLGMREDRDVKSIRRERKVASTRPQPRSDDAGLQALVDALWNLENCRQSGSFRLGEGATLEISNLHKVFWPELGWTKGDLLRYCAVVSPELLPVVADRPLVMKRFPDGIDGEAFYQHRAPEPLPPGARAAALAQDDVPARLVGGDLFTLLYMAQLGSISQDPWFSRVAHPDAVDFVALDLDPMDDVPFSAVNDVARWIHDLLVEFQIPSFPKTSGSSGLHIFIPIAPGTGYESGRLFAQLLSTVVARRHPRVATIERTVAARGKTVYIDYLQNIEGKTLACAYSARASRFAGASTPLTWEEVHAGVNPHDFTIATLPGRIAERGDLWASTREPPHQVDLNEAVRRLSGVGSSGS
jgi:bifunctional non-homologous end joining protein LigD